MSHVELELHHLRAVGDAAADRERELRAGVGSQVVAGEPDREKRIAIYARVQEILHEEVPFAPQGGSVQGHLKKKQLNGPQPNQYVVDITWNIQDWVWA